MESNVTPKAERTKTATMLALHLSAFKMPTYEELQTGLININSFLR